MAKIVSSYTNEQGEVINVYESGAERNTASGKLVRPATHTMNYKGNKTTNPHQLRHKKTAMLLRQAIAAETADALVLPSAGPTAAVAAAGGILWREVVLNKEAYPRDRLEAWKELGVRAEILEAKGSGDSVAEAVTAVANMRTAETLERFWRDVMGQQPDIIDAE